MSAKLARAQPMGTGRSPVSGSGRSLCQVGDLLAGKYRVERLLGEGGMGVVVEAYDQLLDQRVAVKLLYQDVADLEAQSRLLQEARSAAKLQSDHVARVIGVDVGPDGLPFIVMELLEGSDLCQVVDANGALPRWVVVDYVLQALEGLAHAHGRGIIHRDLKPSNLFLTKKPDGTEVIKVLDFGISKSQDAAPDRHTQQLTGARAVLGSPPYMSPEQVRSPKTVDHRTDIWSLGVCMYELLTNSMPFGGDEIQETFAQILEKEPTPVTSIVPGVPEGLAHVVARCLAKGRDARFGDVGELARALAPFGSGTWMQSADRVQATLARALADDLSGASAPRLRGGVSSSDRIAASVRPSGRKLDSQELHGTASTVMARHRMPSAKKRWVAAACVACAVTGIGLIGIGIQTRRHAHAAPTDPQAAVVEPIPVPMGDPGLPPLTGAQPAEVGGVPGAAPAPPPPASILGVSLPPTPIASAPSAAPAAGKGKSPAAAGPRTAGTARPAPRAPAPTTSSKALPAGLPQTRSGQ